MRLIDVDAFREEFALAERCEDCPRRNKKDCDYQVYSARDFCGWLDDFPTVGGWVSVKERLPDKDGEYLVYIHNVYADVIKIAGFSTDKTKEHSYIEAGYGWSNYDHDYGYYDCGNVTHWMPLPEPPEEDDADGKA